jgi:hypothetical protein
MMFLPRSANSLGALAISSRKFRSARINISDFIDRQKKAVQGFANLDWGDLNHEDAFSKT